MPLMSFTSRPSADAMPPDSDMDDELLNELWRAVNGSLGEEHARVGEDPEAYRDCHFVTDRVIGAALQSTKEAKARQFVECARKNGIPNVADPTVDSHGDVDIHPPPGLTTLVASSPCL